MFIGSITLADIQATAGSEDFYSSAQYHRYSSYDMNVSIEDALKEFGINYSKIPEHYKVLCPYHEDSNPSGTIHHKSGFYRCWVCNKQTSLALYLARAVALPLSQVKSKLGFRSDCRNPVSPHDVEREHQDIWKNTLFLKELHDRCITDKIIRERKLGVRDLGKEKRISIPIPNDVGEWANLRLYIPGATEYKFLNLSGSERSRIRLYPIDQLEYDQILICGGELKALAAAAVLNEHGIGAISPTCGEHLWNNELTNRFHNKLIWVNCDVDEVGQKAAESRCRTLKPVVRELHKFSLTLEQVGGLEKGDINDFLRLGGNLYEELLKSPEWILIPGGELEHELAEPVSFREAFSHTSVGKKLQFPGIVTGVLSEDFLIPSKVEIKCSRDQEFCAICDVNSKALLSEGSTVMNIGEEHRTILGLINEDEEKHLKIYKDCFHIPQKCRVCSAHPKEYYHVKEVRLEEQVEPTSRVEPLTMKIGYIVNGPQYLLDAEAYVFEGRLHSSPKNARSSFLISKCEPTKDSLDSYEPSPTDYLGDFQPDKWTLQSLQNKLDQIYNDLEANVTRIWRRRDYHIAIDLSCHSMLHFNFGNTKDINAYVEVLVVGDTAQGKSESMNRIRAHYGLGKKVDCANVTGPGLTIGLERTGGGKYFTSLGVMPRNDRKWLIYEELKKMNPKVWQSLTETRSSGTVTIDKIEHKTRRARNRAFALTNAQDGREIGSYTYGIEAALGVIHTNEDLRRFDLVLIMGKHDITELPERENPPIVEHIFTAELCQKLVLKAWKCEKVRFEDTQHILEVTKRLVDIFGEGLPVLDYNSSHIKIAKLSAALAARTCSYDNDMLVVRRCHVEFIEQYLTRVYSSPSSKLDEKSKAVKNATRLRDRKHLVEYLKSIEASQDIMIKLTEVDVITSQYCRDLCGDTYKGMTLFSKLIQSNAVQRLKGDRYAKTAEFTELLKSTEFGLELPEYLQKRNKGEV